MLKKGREQLPESVFERERFEIPKIRGHLEGNKTIIINFQQIASLLRRPVEHILKFLLKELATPGNLMPHILILATKVPASRINEKVREYALEFVLCYDCGKPDTQILREGEFSFLKCMACGAKHPVKSKI
ncbi:translation initiation factor IF-2 subunit beta [Candidatus Woesearchaeota archaeon]|nr:translation initiation factor IF-2 subunit beta [Candidatus Woesearchaeota archaeon]